VKLLARLEDASPDKLGDSGKKSHPGGLLSCSPDTGEVWPFISYHPQIGIAHVLFAP